MHRMVKQKTGRSSECSMPLEDELAQQKSLNISSRSHYYSIANDEGTVFEGNEALLIFCLRMMYPCSREKDGRKLKMGL